jgi:nucleoid DNA-binding protein
MHTGETVDIAPMTQVRFKAGKGLRDAVQGAAGAP